jgi:C4-dicarboxylate-specific signal transduction histidine kinase
MVALVAFLLFMTGVEHKYNKIGILRAVILILMAIGNLFLSLKGYTKISLLSTIFFPPVIFLFIPTLMGFVEEESFVYYPFILIAFSITPQLLLMPENDKWIYWASMLYYFLFMLFIDLLLRHFAPVKYIIVERIDTFYIYYKASQLLIFFFICFSAFYLRRVNQSYEEELYTANIYLTEQSAILSEKNKVLENNRKELEKKNQNLEKLRQDLKAQNKELEVALKDLKDAQTKLVQSEKLASLGVLTAGVAHEINNPLNYIAGGITMLELEMDEMFEKINAVELKVVLEPLEKNIEKYFLMIKEGVDRVVNIVGALRSYATDTKAPKKLSDINSLIQSALKYLDSKIDRDIHVVVDLKLARRIPVFSEKIHQVFLNIIDNGIFALRKSSKPAKELRISTEEVGGYAKISIFNNGPIIPEEHVLKVFDPFFTTKEPNEGTGLGLSISYNIVKEHRGELELINEQDMIGFNIFLPVSAL